MWNRKDLKAKGKAAFRANYWPSVLAALIAFALSAGGFATVGNNASETTAEQTAAIEQELEGIPPEVVLTILLAVLGVIVVAAIVTTLISAFLFNPLRVGCMRFFTVNSDAPAKLSELGYGYKSNYLNSVKTLLLKDIFIGLWSLLFVIPGLVKAYSYRLTPYILAENPSLSSTEAITLSRKMMNGQKWRAFVLDLSFLGWDILAGLTLGVVGIFYSFPYVCATDAELYKAIRDSYQETAEAL
ncbi:MAG: DUF975 family protein [Oscillibacter sp.]|nr:DUF975 family protein [Oscillibacter sp.]